MAKRASLIDKVIVKFVSLTTATIYYPYVDAVDPNDGGWDTYARQRDSKPFDTVKDARAWVDSSRGPNTMRTHAARLGAKIAYRRVVTHKVPKAGVA